MRWEYRILAHEKQELLVADMNALGADGWEMCGLFLEHGFYNLIFKRQAGGDPLAALLGSAA